MALIDLYVNDRDREAPLSYAGANEMGIVLAAKERGLLVTGGRDESEHQDYWQIAGSDAALLATLAQAKREGFAICCANVFVDTDEEVATFATCGACVMR